MSGCHLIVLPADPEGGKVIEMHAHNQNRNSLDIKTLSGVKDACCCPVQS